MKISKVTLLLWSLLFSMPSYSQHPVENLLEFKKIPKGKFWMGSPRKEPGRYKDEKRHKVTITNSFYMGKTEVTQMQWFTVMGFNPSHFQEEADCPHNHKIIDGVRLCPNRPVENVKFIKVQDFLNLLNSKSSKTYRLPTEAEWEYSARAGNESTYIHGDSVVNIGDYAWFSDNVAEGPKDVATKKPNDFGLYDMSGNVWEWVSDWYDDRYYNRSPRRNPTGPKKGTNKVIRGGSWYSPDFILRISHRGYGRVNDKLSYQQGFRLAHD